MSCKRKGKQSPKVYSEEEYRKQYQFYMDRLLKQNSASGELIKANVAIRSR